VVAIAAVYQRRSIPLTEKLLTPVQLPLVVRGIEMATRLGDAPIIVQSPLLEPADPNPVPAPARPAG
jgi:hypothetical protein